MCRVFSEIGDAHRLDRPLIPMNRRQRFFDMQRPALAVSIAAVPIKKAKGRVAGLLNFGKQDTAADRMNGACRQKDAIAGLRLEAVQAIENWVAERGGWGP